MKSDHETKLYNHIGPHISNIIIVNNKILVHGIYIMISIYYGNSTSAKQLHDMYSSDFIDFITSSFNLINNVECHCVLKKYLTV